MNRLVLFFVLCVGSPSAFSTSIVSDEAIQCGVMVDAGSTSSRVFVYKWAARVTEANAGRLKLPTTLPVPEQTSFSKTVTPGVSWHAEDPTQAAQGIKDLCVFATQSLVDAGCNQLGEVPFFLGATAGLRLLSPETASSLLDVVRAVIGGYGFRVDRSSWIRTISGDEEGAYGWLALNWARAASNSFNTRDTVGVVDLGGASVQISFIPEEDILDNFFSIGVNPLGQDYDIYTHSFLYFGVNEALSRVSERLVSVGATTNPCYASGYAPNATRHLPGSSDPSQCAEAVKGLMEKPATCFEADGSRCSLLGEYQPKIPKNKRFYGIGALPYIWQSMNVTATTDLQGLRDAAYSVCSMDYASLVEYNDRLAHPEKKDIVPMMCFQALYSVGLLTDGFGLSMVNTPLTPIFSINGTKASWASGAMLHMVNHLDWMIKSSASNFIECDNDGQLALGLLLGVFMLTTLVLSYKLYVLKSDPRATTFDRM